MSVRSQDLHNLSKEEIEVLRKAANLMAGNQGKKGNTVADTIFPIMCHIANAHPSTGGLGTHHWRYGLLGLGKTLIALYEMNEDWQG